MPKRMNIVVRLLSKAKIDDPNGCWEWQGYCQDSGHGRISVGGRSGSKVATHRLSYTLFKGDIPEDDVVRHTCDNPPCINPRHLILGSRYDNVQDMVNAGAHRSGYAKLDPHQVMMLRERFALGMSNRNISLAYEIPENTIRDITSRRTWKNAENISPVNNPYGEVPF